MDLAGRIVRRFRSGPDEPVIAGLEDEDADQLFDALGSEMSRAVLAACYEDGQTRSELADELETSIQNISYHVDKLESAGLLEPAETRYGANGSEVLVYEPSKQAVIIAAGETNFVDRLSEAVDKLFAPVALAGLLSLIVGILVRGPAPVGMMGGGGTVTGPTGTQAGLVTAIATFILSIFVILVAAQRGVFDSGSAVSRTGLMRKFLGRSVTGTRRDAILITAIVFGTFLTLDLIATGTAHQLTVVAWLAIQLMIPGGVVLAAVLAYSNDGLFVSWGAASAPVVGIWAYIVGGDLARGGFEPILIALGPVIVMLVTAPVGSIAFLIGQTTAKRFQEADHESLSSQAIGLLVAHPIMAGAITVVYFALVR
ncbi:ArsR/SmtB family transcription factor [Halorubrum amylolyticum]|uniref:ArsR/SmtB family transcription factor n=1 Tax=Halorubrum TaxID=56688 RepID=UPI001008C11E|nr:helix-turn-helix domain-containing protein [Halorubrum amylolyticum]